jgi:hypothetical protein
VPYDSPEAIQSSQKFHYLLQTFLYSLSHKADDVVIPVLKRTLRHDGMEVQIRHS